MNSSYVEHFAESRPVSWHPAPVDLDAVNAGNQLASWFRDSYRVTDALLHRVAACISTCAWAPIVWRNGKCLSEDFVSSGWVSLDFDEGMYTLVEAIREWSDTVHIIGTSKSHQLKKNGKAPKDRFRVVVPWEKPITDQATYSYNVELLIRRYGADRTCHDAARFFWPCREIVSLQLTGYLQPVLPYAPPETIPVNSAQLAELRRDLFGRDLPLWIARLLRGEMPKSDKLQGSRKWACNAAARHLKSLGWSSQDVSTLLHSAEFDRKDFDPSEIDAAVKSAFTSRRPR